MPQASDELRELMVKRFGSIDEQGPIKYLEEQGYRLTGHYFWWPKAGVKSYNDMTKEEYDCLLFLVTEWDFGGFYTKEA